MHSAHTHIGHVYENVVTYYRCFSPDINFSISASARPPVASSFTLDSLYLCVCVCACVCMCMHMCVHVCVHAHMHVHVCVHMCLHVHVCCVWKMKVRKEK